MICSSCDLSCDHAKDGMCRPCRLRKHRRSPLYRWSKAMDAELVEVYRTGKNKTVLTASVTYMAKKYGMPRYIVLNRAAQLNIRSRAWKLWTDAEVSTLIEFAGTTSMQRLAKKLGRSPSSVKQKLFALDVTGRMTDGYSQRELAKLLGLHQCKVAGFVLKGWLRLKDGRVTQSSVEEFVWEHMQEFRFAAADEGWLKAMLLGRAGKALRHSARSLSGVAVALRRAA